MKIQIVKSNKITLPSAITKRLIGRRIEVVEIHEGILLRPVEDSIKNARGFLKGKSSFSSAKFIRNKQIEKELE